MGGRASKGFKASKKGKVRLDAPAIPMPTRTPSQRAVAPAPRPRSAPGGTQSARATAVAERTAAAAPWVLRKLGVVAFAGHAAPAAAPQSVGAGAEAGSSAAAAGWPGSTRSVALAEGLTLAVRCRRCAGTRTWVWASRHRRRLSRATMSTRSARSLLTCRSVAASWCVSVQLCARRRTPRPSRETQPAKGQGWLCGWGVGAWAEVMHSDPADRAFRVSQTGVVKSTKMNRTVSVRRDCTSTCPASAVLSSCSLSVESC